MSAADDAAYEDMNNFGYGRLGNPLNMVAQVQVTDAETEYGRWGNPQHLYTKGGGTPGEASFTTVMINFTF